MAGRREDGILRTPALAWRAVRRLACLAAAGGLLLPAAVRAASSEADWSDRVLRVEVTRQNGSRELGSAVPLVGNRVVTNCHVIRDARDIWLSAPGRRWRASPGSGDAYRDLCFLEVPDGHWAAMPMAQAGEVRVGMPVRAVGYPGGRFAVTEGDIKGLHLCPCDGGRVIQVSAAFDRGASGGGLFDRKGRLVGVLTFKSGAGGNFHFALPVGWLRGLVRDGVQAMDGGHPFWERPDKDSGFFLTACALGAQKAWDPLAELAGEWTRREPDNPESWMALGRASLGLGRPEAAAGSFQRALELDSTHGEAQWELQQLEFELGRSLLGRTGGLPGDGASSPAGTP